MNEYNEKNLVVIYHGGCKDGQTALAIVLRKYPGAKYYWGNYNKPIAFEKLSGKDVVIVDFSYSKADMQRLLSFANSVLVLDHHVSAERELEGFEAPNFEFIYDVNKSGAGLTWDYFYPASEQPMVVQYIQDGDLWTDKYTGTPYLGTFLESSNFTVPEFVEFIQRVINEEIEQPKPSYDSLNVAIGDGLVMYDYKMGLCKSIASKAKPTTLKDGTSALTVCCPGELASNVGALLYDNPNSNGVAITYEMLGDTVKYSMRVSAESSFDASLYAKQFGGGGHKKAAGWSIKLSEFSDGYHTFDELYYHRMVLFAAICRVYNAEAWRSKLHHDGTMFDDYFIVGVTTPTGDFTYHYHIEYWDMFDGVNVLPNAPEWDGHTSDDVTRLLTLPTIN